MTMTPSRRRATIARPRTRLTHRRTGATVRAAVAGVASYVPEEVVTAEEVERRIADASDGFVPQAGVVLERTGVRELGARDGVTEWEMERVSRPAGRSRVRRRGRG